MSLYETHPLNSMKAWALLIGIIFICALVCSPVLAISKIDLISQYKTGEYWKPPNQTGEFKWPTMPTPTSHTPSGYIPKPSSMESDYWFRVKGWIFNETLGDRFIMKSDDPGVAIFNDIGVGKPNIYLYSDRDLIAQVRIAPENAITVSEPAYQTGKGWLAQISHGSLNGKGDFLFYEAVVPDVGWQKEEGYVIRAAYREQDMASMLGHYGFNEKETGEFIDYWVQHLAEDVDYVFYPQETGAVDRVMPLSISPEPVHVMRIWFYAEPLVSAPEPVTSPERIVREGFYVVEWGVMIR
jgi:hypothetical protein